MTNRVVSEFAAFPALVIAAFLVRNAAVLIVLSVLAIGALAVG
ncbi:hypothetical protein [Pseudorhodoplanes sp.]|nr:hypothetical protein [Pseudorhodoplanes sp.]HWV53045.1 hypothetical protein [Pseudorhodoplanes sp.]